MAHELTCARCAQALAHAERLPGTRLGKCERGLLASAVSAETRRGGQLLPGLPPEMRRAKAKLVRAGLLYPQTRPDRKRRRTRPERRPLEGASRAELEDYMRARRAWRAEARWAAGQEWFHPQLLRLTPLGDAVVALYREQIEQPGRRITWNVSGIQRYVVAHCPRRERHRPV